jgi:hypothetical protein
MTGTALVIPQHSKNSPNGLLKSLLVGTSGMLPKRFFTRNSDMILVPTVGLLGLLFLFPLTNKAWPWKVKESKLL